MKILCMQKNFNDDIKKILFLFILRSQTAEKTELKPAEAKVINFDSHLKNFN